MIIHYMVTSVYINVINKILTKYNKATRISNNIHPPAIATAITQKGRGFLLSYVLLGITTVLT